MSNIDRSDEQNRSHDFDSIYQTCRPSVIKACTKALGPQDAEDCCQQVFMKVLKHISSFDGSATVKTWVLAITKHEIADELLRRKHESEVVVRKLDGKPRVIQRRGSFDEKAALRQALICLPEMGRHLFLGKHLVGLNQEELAARYGISRHVVADLLREAKQKLREALA